MLIIITNTILYLLGLLNDLLRQEQPSQKGQILMDDIA